MDKEPRAELIRALSDPSILTTQQILREVASLKETIYARLDAMDKAIILLQEITNRQPTPNEIYMKHEEKFKAIDQHFEDRKLAWDAVVLAAKEAVAIQNTSSALAISKSEAIAGKQIEQQAEMIRAINKTLDDKISDVKDRVTLIEGKTSGATDTQRRGGEIWGLVFGGIGLLMSIVALVLAISRIK